MLALRFLYLAHRMAGAVAVELDAVSVDAKFEWMLGRVEHVAQALSAADAVGTGERCVWREVEVVVSGDHQRNGSGRGVVKEGLKARRFKN